jgi:hypothetical protein
VSIYVCWSFRGEASRDIRDLDNRFSTMTEVRRVESPFWESLNGGSDDVPTGKRGALELFFRAWMPFQALVGEVAGHTVPVFQRVEAGCRSTNVCSTIRIRSYAVTTDDTSAIKVLRHRSTCRSQTRNERRCPLLSTGHRGGRRCQRHSCS